MYNYDTIHYMHLISIDDRIYTSGATYQAKIYEVRPQLSVVQKKPLAVWIVKAFQVIVCRATCESK